MTVLYTIGHSTHPIEQLVGLLRQHQITTLVDVRSFPRSRRHPQFNQEALAAIGDTEISYRWAKSLGGRRPNKRVDSPHSAWTVAGFRSYADHTETAEFADGFAKLLAIAGVSRTVIMCAEGMWWQCHRRIISDQTLLAGWDVQHVMPDGKLVTHQLPPFASVVGGRIVYDGGQLELPC